MGQVWPFFVLMYSSRGQADRAPLSPETMTPEQESAALRLIHLLEGDLEAQANCKIYGNWLEHLADHLSDLEIDRINNTEAS
jgi:hypothetical protein